MNDISAGTFDGGMLQTVARLGGATVLDAYWGELSGESGAGDEEGDCEQVRDYLGGGWRRQCGRGLRGNGLRWIRGLGFREDGEG